MEQFGIGLRLFRYREHGVAKASRFLRLSVSVGSIIRASGTIRGK